MIKVAKSKVDETSLAIQTELYASGLTSDAATAFLNRCQRPKLCSQQSISRRLKLSFYTLPRAVVTNSVASKRADTSKKTTTD